MQHKYRVYCNTESAFVEEWSTYPPTECPNNVGHSIDTNSIVITDEQSSYFGKYYSHVKEMSESSIVGTTEPQLKVSLELPNVVLGSYRFSYSFDWSYSNKNGIFTSKICLDTTSILDTVELEPAKNNEVYHESGFMILDDFIGDHQICLLYETSNINYTAKISNAVMEFWRIE